MSNNNETVEQVFGEFKTSIHTCKNCDFKVCPSIIVFADRILDAHNREIDAIAAQKTAEAHEAFVKNAELAEAISAKDAEIEDLKKENARLRALVNGLADALDRRVCRIKDCRTMCGAGMGSCMDIDHRELVSKAREVVK